MSSSKLLLLSNLEYYQKIKQLFGSSIIAHWPMWEGSGSVAYDISGNGRNGAPTGIDWGYPGIGDGHTCPYFDGANDYVNVHSASLLAAFNGEEGTLLIPSKVYNAGVWTDGLNRYINNFYVDGNNYIQIYKPAANDLHWRYKAGGVLCEVTLATTPTTYMFPGLTWSKTNNRMRAFFNKSQIGVDQVGLGVWAGILDATHTVIGDSSTGHTAPWYGYIGHGILRDCESTPAEMAKAMQI